MSVKQKLEDLNKEVREEIERIWLEEPEQVRKLRTGFIDSDAGSYGQYFSTFVFVDGEIRALGYLCYTTVLNVIEDSSFDAVHIRKLAKLLIPVCAEFLGYCGFTKVWEFSRRFLDLVDRTESKEGLKELVRSLVLYVNRMHGWVHYYFPWGLGSQYRIKGEDDIEQLESLIKKRKERKDGTDLGDGMAGNWH